jgi:hypothetical protein
MVNTYRAEFFARCPINGARVHYTLRIETLEVIPVERINDVLHDLREGLHEGIADSLCKAFGGRQTMTAFHHGVAIETVRGLSHFSSGGTPPGGGLLAYGLSGRTGP